MKLSHCPQKPTVVLVINCLQGGGAERSVLTLGQGFFELGYAVHIVRFKPLVEYDLSPDLHYHLIRFKAYKLIPHTVLRHRLFARKVDNYILTHIGKPDVVLSNLERPDRVMTHSRLDNLLYVIRNTVSQEFKLDGNPKRQAIVDDLRRVYQNHPCICVSQGVADDLHTVFGNRLTTQTIYNAFDQQLIEQMAHEAVNWQQYGLEKGRYLMHLGSFKPQKAHDVLLKAYAQSSQRYPLVLVGQGQGLDDIQALAKTLGVADKVKFFGFHKNPYPLLKHACALVLSSRFEGFVRVVGEALALGVPVVSTDCPSGPSELLPKSNLVPVDDVTALTRIIDDGMANPSAYWVPFDARFLPKNIARQYVDYLNNNNP